MIRFAVLALVLLGACATAPVDPAAAQPASERVDPWALYIDVGRLNVMLSHVDDLTGETADMPGSDPHADSPRNIARALRETVWKYNLTRSQLCARGLYIDISCSAAFAPDWLRDAPTIEPPLQLLEDRAGVVSTRVMQLWDRVCDDAKAHAANDEDRQTICGIE